MYVFFAKAMSSSALDAPLYATGDSFSTGESLKLRKTLMLGPVVPTHFGSDVWMNLYRKLTSWAAHLVKASNRSPY